MRRKTLSLLQKIFTSVFVFGYVFSLSMPAFAHNDGQNPPPNNKPVITFANGVESPAVSPDVINIVVTDGNNNAIPNTFRYIFVSNQSDCSIYNWSWYWLDYQPQYVSGQNFSITVDSNNRGKYLCAFASDNNNAGGNSEHDTVAVSANKFDYVQSVTINSGAAYTNSRDVTLTLTAPSSVVHHFRVSETNSFPGDSGWIHYTSSYPYSIGSAGDGLKTVYVKYKETNTVVSDTIKLDTSAPTGSITINNGDVYTKSLGVTLTLSISSDVTSMNINGAGWETFAGTKSITLDSGPDGVRTVSVVYKDLGGNLSSVYSDTIIVDSAVDSVVANSLTIDDTTPTLTGTYSDILSGISTVKVNFEGTDYTATTNPDGTWYWDEPSTLADGAYPFYATATDVAGNTLKSNDANLVIRTDHVAPIVNVLSPIGLYQTVSTITGTANDADSGIKNVAMHIYRINDDLTTTLLYTSIPAVLSGTDWTADISGYTFTDGTYQIAAWAYDNAGNPGWAQRVNFTVDSTAPSVPTNGLPNSTYTTTNNFDFTWDASTDASAIAYEFQSSMNPAEVGGVLTTSLWHSGILPTNMIHSSGAPDGTWYWQVRALDAAGNYSNWSPIWTITLDTQAPATPILVSPIDGAFVNGASVTNEWSDVSTDVAYFIYESYKDQGLTDLRWTENFTSTSKTATSVADASFWWRVKAVDFAGNESGWSSAWKVTVDNIVPVTSFVGDISNSDFNSPIYLQGSSSDVNGVSAVKLYFRNSDLSSDWTLIDTINNTSALLPFAWAYTWTPPYQGAFDIKASGVDLAGNTEHSPMMTNITYDTTSPTIGNVNIAIDYLSKYVNGQTGFLISAPVSDSLSGINKTSCKYTLDGTTWSNGTLIGNRCTFGVLSSQLFDNQGLEISAQVKDKAGNTVVSNIVERKVDKNLPQSQTIIDNDFYGPNSLPLVKGVASDTVSDVTNVMFTMKRSSNNKYWLIGNVWTPIPMMHDVSGNETWTYTDTLPPMQNGVTYTVTPYAWDQVHALPRTGIADSFIWDSQLPQDPTTFVASHALNTPRNDNTIEVSFNGASDAVSGVAGYYYSFSHTPETPAISPSNWLPYGTTSVTSPSLEDGVWYFNIRTLDNAGNITSTTHYGSLIVDTTAPDVDITAPASTHISGTVEVRGTVTDANPHHYWFVIVNSAGTQVAGLNTVNDATSFTDKLLLNWNTTSLPDGKYTIKLEARDAANNKDSGSVEWLTVYVDNTKPTVDLVFETPSTEAKGFKAVFSEDMNVADAENPVNYFLNNWPTAGGSGDLFGDASIIYDSETYTATITFLSSGWYLSPEQQWGVQNIQDLAGNMLSVTPYTEYTTPMVAPVTTASDIDTLWHNTDVTVTLTCIDVDGSGCYETYYSLNGGPKVVGNTVVVSTEGLNIITFSSTDNAGNEELMKTSEVIKIDKTNPTAQVLGALTFTTGDTTPRGIQLTDDNGLYQACYTIDTATQQCVDIGGTGYFWDVSNLINTLGVGSHTFSYYVIDTAGNQSDSDTLTTSNEVFASNITVSAPPAAVRGVATRATAETTTTEETTAGEETTNEEEDTNTNVTPEVKGVEDTSTTEQGNGFVLPWWAYAIAGGVLLFFIFFLIWKRRKEKEEENRQYK